MGAGSIGAGRWSLLFLYCEEKVNQGMAGPPYLSYSLNVKPGKLHPCVPAPLCFPEMKPLSTIRESKKPGPIYFVPKEVSKSKKAEVPLLDSSRPPPMLS